MENTNHGVRPQNYMVLAIIATVLGCCTFTFYGIAFILGIVGVYFASQVNSNFNSGNLEMANKNSKYAKITSLIAIALIVIYLIFIAYILTFNPEIIEQSREQAEQMLEAWGMEVPQE